jgi:hypothetical protein
VVAYLQPRLQDLDPFWFSEAALEGVFLKVRTLNSADRVRKVLRDFHARQAPPPPTGTPMEQEWRSWNERQEFLRKDWDDPDGIMRKVRDCDGHPMRNFLLRRLGLILAKHAPQHLGCLPPDILRDMERNASPDLRSILNPIPRPLGPDGSRQDQLNTLHAGEPDVSHARHLTPVQLDAVNPLPNGRKRVA